MHPHSRTDLEWLTARIIEYRNWRARQMAMKLKGLRDKAAMFRSALDDVGQAYEAGTDAAKAHATEVRGLKDEFTDLKDDLDFAIGTVGNSSAITGNVDEPEKPAQKVSPQEAVRTPGLTPIAPAPASRALTAGLIPAAVPLPTPSSPPLVNTFRAEAEQQIAAGHK